ncbi:hypothetical protein EV363DRAFT_1360424 [Boletus edulis]|nr:hypothetical protein EV363DRAFT_1360424 [Boletus edulis]
MINNNVASVEDVADSSLSPAGRVTQPPSATSSTGHFSFHFDQYEEWTDEVEARMQNEIDRMLEDARRVLAEPYPNISELFPDDLLADSVAHQTVADSLASRFAAADELIRELEAVAEDDSIPEESLADEFVVEEDAHSPPRSFKHAICFETRSASRRRPSHRFHQRLLTSTCDGGGGDGSLPTPTLWRCDCHISIHHIEKQKKNRKLNKIDQRRLWRRSGNIALANTQSTSPWWNGIVAREAVM